MLKKEFEAKLQKFRDRLQSRKYYGHLCTEAPLKAIHDAREAAPEGTNVLVYISDLGATTGSITVECVEKKAKKARVRRDEALFYVLQDVTDSGLVVYSCPDPRRGMDSVWIACSEDDVQSERLALRVHFTYWVAQHLRRVRSEIERLQREYDAWCRIQGRKEKVHGSKKEKK